MFKDNGTGEHDSTSALTHAINQGLTDVASILIQRGANVNHRNNHNSTPLLIAVERGHIDIVRTLISRGVDVHAVDNDGDNALHNTINGETYDSDKIEILNLLLANGAKSGINAKNNKGYTPLDKAEYKEYTDAIKLLKNTAPKAQA